MYAENPKCLEITVKTIVYFICQPHTESRQAQNSVMLGMFPGSPAPRTALALTLVESKNGLGMHRKTHFPHVWLIPRHPGHPDLLQAVGKLCPDLQRMKRAWPGRAAHDCPPPALGCPIHAHASTSPCWSVLDGAPNRFTSQSPSLSGD